MLEQLRKRRAYLIATMVLHVIDKQQYHPEDDGYDPDVPSFADNEDLSYYHRLRGRIEECRYMMDLLTREMIT